MNCLYKIRASQYNPIPWKSYVDDTCQIELYGLAISVDNIIYLLCKRDRLISYNNFDIIIEESNNNKIISPLVLAFYSFELNFVLFKTNNTEINSIQINNCDFFVPKKNNKYRVVYGKKEYSSKFIKDGCKNTVEYFFGVYYEFELNKNPNKNSNKNPNKNSNKLSIADLLGSWVFTHKTKNVIGFVFSLVKNKSRIKVIPLSMLYKFIVSAINNLDTPNKYLGICILPFDIDPNNRYICNASNDDLNNNILLKINNHKIKNNGYIKDPFYNIDLSVISFVVLNITSPNDNIQIEYLDKNNKVQNCIIKCLDKDSVYYVLSNSINYYPTIKLPFININDIVVTKYSIELFSYMRSNNIKLLDSLNNIHKSYVIIIDCSTNQIASNYDLPFINMEENDKRIKCLKINKIFVDNKEYVINSLNNINKLNLENANDIKIEIESDKIIKIK